MVYRKFEVWKAVAHDHDNVARVNGAVSNDVMDTASPDFAGMDCTEQEN